MSMSCKAVIITLLLLLLLNNNKINIVIIILLLCYVQASGAVKRASRGGMLVGSQLLAVASTLTGATRLQRSVMGASRAADSTGDYDLFAVLTHRFKVGAVVICLCHIARGLVTVSVIESTAVAVHHLLTAWPPLCQQGQALPSIDNIASNTSACHQQVGAA